MNGLPLQARIFLLVVLCAALGVAATSAVASSGHLAAALGLTTFSDQLVSLVAVLSMVVTGLYPICIGNKIRTSVGATIIFATVMLMQPLRVLALVAPSVACYTILNSRRERWPLYYPVFNVAQLSLAAMVTSHLFHRFDAASDLRLASPAAVGHIALAVACYFLINSSIVATMSALVAGRSPLRVWIAMYRPAWAKSLSVLVLGVAIAVVYMYAPLGVILFAIPLVVIHQAYSNAVTIGKQTKETLEVLADVIDKRDPHTYAHSQRVAEYARLTARRLGLPEQEQEAIALAARVHDVGKIAVREELLRKPDRLTQTELDEVRRHTLIGAEIVGKLAEYSKSKDAILYHHERWDGSGIHRLAYEHIPLGARIIAVADAFDAMTSDRPYRHALSWHAACAELEKAKGSQFDPVVVAAFLDAVSSLEPGALADETSLELEAHLPRRASAPQVRH